MIIGDSRSGKTGSLFNLIIQERDIDKIYLYVKDPYEAKYHFLINKPESTKLEQIRHHLNDSKAFIEYSNDRDDIYKNIEKCIPNKKIKMSIVFDDMIPVTLSNKKLNPIAKPLSYFITQPYFAEPKNIRLNSMHYFVMKIPNKQGL